MNPINLGGTINTSCQSFYVLPHIFSLRYGAGNPKRSKYCFINITKEALTNIMNHSHADYVQLYMREHPGLYQLCIEDTRIGPTLPGGRYWID